MESETKMAKQSQLPKKRRDQGVTKAPVKAKGTGSSRSLLLGVIGAVAVLAIGLIWLAVQAGREPIVATDRIGEGATWGPEGAVVSIINYSDFGCPHCATFALNQAKQLREEYEATGKVRFEFKHFIIGGENTRGAALAAECAADQGKFWDYHDVLFQQQGITRDPFNRSALKSYAAQLGLDTAQFNQCLDSNQHLEKVARDSSEARSRGVNATPTFFVNGQKVEGAQPYSVFKALVDSILVAQ